MNVLKLSSAIDGLTVVRMTEREIINGALREMPYAEYLQTNHWQTVRQRALKASRYRCSVCLSPSRLDVHHITYERLGDELPADVVALCHDHHARQHEIIRHILHAEQERLRSET